MGPLYGVPLKEGDGCTLTVSTYANGDVRATVYEYDRMPGVLLVLCPFFAATVLVGGKTGARRMWSLCCSFGRRVRLWV